MRTALFLKTYAGDREWLPYCLRSIQKFCTGYDSVVVVSENFNVVRPIVEKFGFTFVCVPFPDYHGYLQQQVVKLQADMYVPPGTSHVVYTDTDAIFNSPNTPKTWHIKGRPRLVVNSFAFLRKSGSVVPWQKPTERALRMPCPWETMRLQPLIFSTHTIRAARERVENKHHVSIEEYARRIGHPYGTFSEFNILGNFAMRFHRQDYHVVNYDNGYYKLPSAEQYGFCFEGREVKPERAKHFEKLLA